MWGERGSTSGEIPHDHQEIEDKASDLFEGNGR
jgi:hypothetical protein